MARVPGSACSTPRPRSRSESSVVTFPIRSAALTPTRMRRRSGFALRLIQQDNRRLDHFQRRLCLLAAMEEEASLRPEPRCSECAEGLRRSGPVERPAIHAISAGARHRRPSMPHKEGQRRAGRDVCLLPRRVRRPTAERGDLQQTPRHRPGLHRSRTGRAPVVGRWQPPGPAPKERRPPPPTPPSVRESRTAWRRVAAHVHQG